MRKITVLIVGLAAAVMLGAGGCTPRVAGIFSEEPVDRATFELQAARRRGELDVRKATLTAELAAAEKLGDPLAVAEINAKIAKHEIERKTYNDLYGQGVDGFDRQTDSNERIFTALTAAGEYGAVATGIPPGVSQLALGVLLAFAGRAGWLRMRKPKPAATPASAA